MANNGYHNGYQGLVAELEKGKTTKVLKQYSNLSVTEALEKAKQRLTVLAACLKMYI